MLSILTPYSLSEHSIPSLRMACLCSSSIFSVPKAHIGWLAGLANATDQPYTANNTGGPSIKVSSDPSCHHLSTEKLQLQLQALITLTQ